MKPVFRAPRELLDRKPPHGAACTQCGLCCIATQCDLSRHVFGDRGGPCPALGWDEKKHAFCGLVLSAPTDAMRDAALHLTRTGQGCDARFNGEPRNAAFDASLDALDKRTRGATIAARQEWGMP